MLSTDSIGVFKQAMLTGGTTLESPVVRIQLRQKELTGKIVFVDYNKRAMVLDTAWTEQHWPQLVKISNPWFQTGFTVINSEATPDGKTKLFVKEAPMVYRAEIKTLDPVKRTVIGTQPFFYGTSANGRTLTNTRQDRFWKYKAESTLDGQKPLSNADFDPDNTMCCWEYGPDDTVTLQAKALVTRSSDGRISAIANVPGSAKVFENGNWTEYNIK